MPRLIPRLSAAERTAFITAARSLHEKPFRHRGRDASGVDCIGLAIYGLASLGYAVAEPATYSRRPTGSTLRDALIAHLGDPIAPEQAQPGDIALMSWFMRDGVPMFNHVGILTAYPLGGFALLHSYAPNRAVVEHRLDEAWAGRIAEIYSLTGDR